MRSGAYFSKRRREGGKREEEKEGNYGTRGRETRVSEVSCIKRRGRQRTARGGKERKGKERGKERGKLNNKRNLKKTGDTHTRTKFKMKC